MNDEVKSEIFSWLLWLGGGLLAAVILMLFVFRLTVINGESMMNTLEEGQIVYADKLTYTFSKPKRGDIIVCSDPGYPDKIIKRVIGLPGETIRIENGVAYINGDPSLDLWVGNHIMNDMGTVAIPSDCYFVMGDNRSESLDSRDMNIGTIEEKDIMGKVLFSLYPFDTFGKLKFKL